MTTTRRTLLTGFALGAASLVTGASVLALPAAAGNGHGDDNGNNHRNRREHRRNRRQNRRDRN